MTIREKLEMLERDLDAVRGKSPDRNVEAVRQMLLGRSVVGFRKYGVTTERGDLTRAQWLRHLQEELLDASVYIQALINLEPPTTWICCCGHTDITVPVGQECPICKP